MPATPPTATPPAVTPSDGALDIAVIGAGIGGLTTALALMRGGHRVSVWERASVLRPVGAGISLWANGVKVLDRLGLAGRLAEVGGRMERMGYVASDGRALCEFSLEPLWARVGQRAWPVSRSDLADLLLDAVGPEQVHLGARCTGVESEETRATAHFADGRSVRADIVVGADGTHSPLRSWVVGRPVARRPVGYVNVNGLVDDDASVAPTGVWRTWVGDGRRVAVMPIGGGRRYVWFDLTGADPDDTDADAHAEVAAAFAGWPPAVARLVEQVRDTTLNRVGIYDLETLPTWRRGRVVILGDAAHTMAPDLGQGGCQAMEDGWTLAEELADTTTSVTGSLDRWAGRRRDHTAGMVVRARRRAEVTHGADPAATAAWYEELADEDGTRILDGLAQSVLTGPLG